MLSTQYKHTRQNIAHQDKDGDDPTSWDHSHNSATRCRVCEGVDNTIVRPPYHSTEEKGSKERHQEGGAHDDEDKRWIPTVVYLYQLLGTSSLDIESDKILFVWQIYWQKALLLAPLTVT